MSIAWPLILPYDTAFGNPGNAKETGDSYEYILETGTMLRSDTRNRMPVTENNSFGEIMDLELCPTHAHTEDNIHSETTSIVNWDYVAPEGQLTWRNS